MIAFSCSKSEEVTQDVIKQQDTQQSLMRVSNNSNVILTPAAAIADGDNYSTQDALLLVESMLNENHTTKNSTYYNVLHSTTTIAGFTNSSSHTGTETQSLYNQASNFVSSLMSEVPPIAIDVSESGDDGTVQIDVIFPDEPICPICPPETVAEPDGGPDCENYDDELQVFWDKLIDINDDVPNVFFQDDLYFQMSQNTANMFANVFNSSYPNPDNLLYFSNIQFGYSILLPCFDNLNTPGNPCESISGQELNLLFIEVNDLLSASFGGSEAKLIAVEMKQFSIYNAETNTTYYYWQMNYSWGFPIECCNCCC